MLIEVRICPGQFPKGHFHFTSVNTEVAVQGKLYGTQARLSVGAKGRFKIAQPFILTFHLCLALWFSSLFFFHYHTCNRHCLEAWYISIDNPTLCAAAKLNYILHFSTIAHTQVERTWTHNRMWCHGMASPCDWNHYPKWWLSPPSPHSLFLRVSTNCSG